MRKTLLFCATAAMSFAHLSSAQEFSIPAHETISATTEYSPFLDQHFPDRVFWGDSHLHTSNSPDAGMVGNTLPPDAAYRFAKGEEVTSSTGIRTKLVRPLDWLVVSDHSEYMGLAPMLFTGDEALLSDPFGAWLYEEFNASGERANAAFLKLLNSVTRGELLIENPDVLRSVWEDNNETADNHNDPGKFTAFIGYEWSSIPSGNNLHRVVIFRDDAARANQVVPFSSIDSPDPEDLWDFMEAYEKNTGGRVMALAHNGNWSNGLMFAETKYDGSPIDAEYSERRMHWEPIYEVTQIKGDGETHPYLSPDDEFADFETWDKGNGDGSVAKTNDMLRHEYARSALNLGLELDASGVGNPYRFGLVGSTDSHTSLATAREDNYFGKFAQTEPSSERWKHTVIASLTDPALSTFSKAESAAGLAGVWARENTRASIFEAMQRKEVYATTGPRMIVRAFAGYGFEESDLQRPDFAAAGYAGGVPMGGDLQASDTGAAPRLMIRALRDPDGANLDRVQVIKGWLGADGVAQERIYDVACSDDRAIRDRRCETDVGSTVDVATATYTNDIGNIGLVAFWEDPDFDQNQNAWYYVRVIEIPKPRWSAYDQVRLGAEMDADVPLVVQDRAYTSPIWYTPG